MTTPRKLFLSIDIGTTAIKTGLFTSDGKLIAMEKREQKLIFLGFGRVEQSIQETWRLITELVRMLMKDQVADEVSAIALSVQRGSVIPLDATGMPLSNQIVWMDNRGLPFVEWLHNNIGLEAYYNISGHGLSHITGVSKLLWLRHGDPTLWERIKVIGTPQTLFLKWLGCKDFICDLSSGTYIFPFDVDRKIWSQELAAKLDFPIEKLPKLVTATEVVGTLSQAAAKELGLKSGISLVAGGGDGQCAAAGCGVITPGLGMINIGTGAGVQCYLQTPLRDPACVLSLAAHVVTDGWEMEGHTQASGAVLRWLRDEFGYPEKVLAVNSQSDAFDFMIDQARSVAPGAEGLLLIPTFNGSTGPKVDLYARGILMGLSLSHERKHIIRAFLEGITLEIRWMLDAIIHTGASIKDLRLVGGGSRNQFWNQIHADILNHPISTLEQSEAALVGAAMCAVVAVGEYQNLSEAATQFVRIKETIDPLTSNHQIYQVAYEKYKEIFTLLSEKGIHSDVNKQVHHIK
ncbi:MAG: FGGY family carbohydrate kinase [Chloroflexi bacterium]|nr:FGGY family carbohydrate kinase [Chloroflexota bacterium]